MTSAALQDLFLRGNRCFGCGPENPDGLHLKFYEDGDELVAEWTPEERFQGPPASSMAASWRSRWTATRRGPRCTPSARTAVEPPSVRSPAGYSVRLIAPSPVGHRVVLRALVTERDERKAKVSVTATVEADSVATFDGTFVVEEFDYSSPAP